MIQNSLEAAKCSCGEKYGDGIASHDCNHTQFSSTKLAKQITVFILVSAKLLFIFSIGMTNREYDANTWLREMD